MDYVGQIFRPPSEAASLLLQVTVGCSHNACTYCAMYRDKRFAPKRREVVAADIERARQLGPVFRRVFLCDGDAMILSTARLLEILEKIGRDLPWVERVGVYGDTRSVTSKSIDELVSLKNAGLGIVYHGVESGNDQVLNSIEKGGTRADSIETAERLRAAGIRHSVMLLLGVAGTTLSERHASDTATLLSKMDPAFAGVLTTTVVPGTPLHAAQAQGRFELPDKFAMLRELRTIVAESDLSNCRFSANHASNYLPVTCVLPDDKEMLISLLDGIVADADPRTLKPESLRGL